MIQDFFNYPFINSFNDYFYKYIPYVLPVLAVLLFFYLCIRLITNYIYKHKKRFFKNRGGCDNDWYENESLKNYKETFSKN